MELWSIILALVAVILASYYYYKKSYSHFEQHGLPVAKPFPLLGSIWKGMVGRLSFADALLEVYNATPEAKYIGFYEFSTPGIMIRDIEMLKSVTVKNFEHFLNHRTFPTAETDIIFSKNLFALTDERWKDVRAMLSPAFTSSKMKAMFKLMRDCAQQYGETLSKVPEEKRVMELKDVFTRYTNDVIATCAFGIKVDSMKDPTNKFYVYGGKATKFSKIDLLKISIANCIPWLGKMFKIRLFDPIIASFFTDLVASTIKTRDEKGIVRPDMIQLMMETRGKVDTEKELTIEEMAAQAFSFFFGGFESTSTLMCFAAYEVGVNPDIQSRLQDEIDQVLEACNGEVTYDAISDMKYLDAIINETLRMYPVFLAIDRVCTKPFELPPALPGLKPFHIEKGAVVWIPAYGIHHDPQYYEDPQKFNPDRFLDDPKKFQNAGTFWSFGMGPRRCIGNRFAILKTKVLLFHVFARCNLKPCSKTTIPRELSKEAQMKMKGGYWFDVQPRETNGTSLVNSLRSS